MKLCYDKKSKDPTYYVQMGVRNGKKVTTKNIARIGKHSELLKITDDPLAYAKEQIAKYNEEPGFPFTHNDVGGATPNLTYKSFCFSRSSPIRSA